MLYVQVKKDESITNIIDTGNNRAHRHTGNKRIGYL